MLQAVRPANFVVAILNNAATPLQDRLGRRWRNRNFQSVYLPSRHLLEECPVSCIDAINRERVMLGSYGIINRVVHLYCGAVLSSHYWPTFRHSISTKAAALRRARVSAY